MAKVYDSILDLVGKTPLVELKRIEEKEGLQATPVSYTHLTLPTIA